MSIVTGYNCLERCISYENEFFQIWKHRDLSSLRCWDMYIYIWWWTYSGLVYVRGQYQNTPRSFQYIEGLMQNCSNSIVSAMELLQYCTKQSIWSSEYVNRRFESMVFYILPTVETRESSNFYNGRCIKNIYKIAALSFYEYNWYFKDVISFLHVGTY